MMALPVLTTSLPSQTMATTGALHVENSCWLDSINLGTLINGQFFSDAVLLSHTHREQPLARTLPAMTILHLALLQSLTDIVGTTLICFVDFHAKSGAQH